MVQSFKRGTVWPEINPEPTDELENEIVPIGTVPVLTQDPTLEDIPEASALLYISDGSSGVTGSEGDLIRAMRTYDADGNVSGLNIEVGVDLTDGGGGLIGGLL